MTVASTLPDFNNPGKQVISPSKLAHIVLNAFDFEKQKQFYLNFLNAKVQFENPHLAFLTYDEEHHRIALVNKASPGKVAPKDNTLVHIAFTFSSLADLLMAYKQRLQHGIKPSWCINHGPTVSLYYIDPEGNKIETQFDVFDKAEDANAFMESPDFAENPIGVTFDPEEMIAKLVAGEKESDLMKRPTGIKGGMELVPEVMR